MSIRKRKWTSGGKEKETWIVDYVDQRGKRRHKSYSTKKEATEGLIKIMSEVSSGNHVAERDSITIKEASELWEKSWSGSDLEESSMRSYQSILQHNILPLIGNRLLSKFLIQDVMSYQVELKNCTKTVFT